MTPSRPSANYSTTNLKKNKVLPLLLFPVLFLPLSVSSQELTVDQNFHGNTISVSVILECDCQDMVFQSLEDGLEAEVVFEIRLYKEGTGFFSHWGGRLVAEKTVSYVARKDFFEDTYLIESTEGDTTSISDPEAFNKRFYRVSHIELGDLESDNKGEHYLLARARLTHVKLMPPLAIITLFRPLGIATEWHRKEIKIP